MSRLEAWSVHLSTILVGGTGLVYGWMKYLVSPTEPWAVVNHPAQPTMQHLHVLTAPLLIFAAGFIWKNHVWKHYRNGVSGGRRSGVVLLANLMPMIASGYLIQITVSPAWRTAWIAIHCATAFLWLVGYAGHYVARKRRGVTGEDSGETSGRDLGLDRLRSDERSAAQ